MMGIDKTIGRLIAVLVDAGIIERNKAAWILEPLKDATVDAEPVRHGKWIDYVNSHCTCTACGSDWSYFENETERFKCCPNCGAYMRGETNE